MIDIITYGFIGYDIECLHENNVLTLFDHYVSFTLFIKHLIQISNQTTLSFVGYF